MAAWEPSTSWWQAAGKLEVEDSEDLLRSWAEREHAVFIGLGNSSGPADDGVLFDTRPSLLPEERAHAKQVLRVLLAREGLCEEMPAALTLLDALALAAEHRWPLEGPFLTPAVLAAVFRIVVKVTLQRRDIRGSLSDEALFRTILSLQLAIDEPSAVARAEIGVFAALDGRVWTPSPVDWARATMWRLEAFVVGSAETHCSCKAQAKLWHLQTGIDFWAAFMIDRLAARPQLQPRVLAIGACALDLVGAGLMAAEELRLEELSEGKWAEAVLARAERAASRGVALAAFAGPGDDGAPSTLGGQAQACRPGGSGAADGTSAVTVEELAEAACYSVEELRENVGVAMAALRASLDDSPSPW